LSQKESQSDTIEDCMGDAPTMGTVFIDIFDNGRGKSSVMMPPYRYSSGHQYHLAKKSPDPILRTDNN
jgi:hypothetical protein